MRRAILVAALAVVAAVLAPVASAGAVTVTGPCTLEGNAVFSPPLTAVPNPSGHYEFASTSVNCTTTPATTAQSAKVEGTSLLSCIVSPGGGGGEPFSKLGTPGTGEIKYKEGVTAVTHKITSFKFLGTGNKVKFETEGEVKSSGEAEFPSSAAKECGTGASSLTFTATINAGGTL
jgi:hypothetical protein